MLRFATLAAQAEKLQQEAAATGQALAQGLLRPTGDRDGLAAAAEGWAGQLQAAQALALRMRRLVGPSAMARGGEEASAYAAFARKLQQWDTALQAVRLCLAGQEWPLVLPAPPKQSLAAAQMRLLSDCLTLTTFAITPIDQNEKGRELGYFQDIPLSAAQFVELAHFAYRLCLAQKRPRPWRFVDVGCGGALKVALAGAFFDDVCGIDYDPGYVAAARQTLMAMRLPVWRVEHADGLTYEGYGDFDILYFYMPIRPDSGLLELEARIAAGAWPGTILIAPYSDFRPRAEALGCTEVGTFIYLKDVPPDEAEALVAEAGRMGPDIPLRPPVSLPGGSVPRDIGWLGPVWRACIENGICPG
jgi:SAM-dependent methyltransferase